MPRPQQERHGFGGHDGEILGGGEMRDAEGVPEDDVSVVDGVGGRGGDPGGEALRGGAARLRDVAAGGVDFGVGV